MYVFFLYPSETSSDMLIGLYLLWKIGIAHGDISLSNMMYYEENGQLYGVLNDFDLAAEMQIGERSPKKQGFERTGTLPFMALDLLETPDGRMTRWFRHDLEACMWCIVLHSLKLERVDLYNGPPSDVRMKKRDLVSTLRKGIMKEDWKCYHKFLRSWALLFIQRREDREDLISDLEDVDERYEVWREADGVEKNEDYMRPDAQQAKDLMGDKGAKVLEDLSWIDLEVEDDPSKTD